MVVATGDHNRAQVPALARRLPGRIDQHHTADYRGPGQLPDGAALVVGSAQSGCQITEDLLAGGRRVFLSTSPVGRVPFRHRGRETVEGWSRPASWTSGHATCPTLGHVRRHADPGRRAAA